MSTSQNVILDLLECDSKYRSPIREIDELKDILKHYIASPL